jgi:hypothetical protein
MLSSARFREVGGKSNLHTDALDRMLARARRPLDRSFERRAVALDGLAALSADVGARLAELAPAAGSDPRSPAADPSPRVLFLSLRGATQSAYELVLAHALQLRGAQVALLTCGGGMPACEFGWARSLHPRPCDRCAWLTDRLAAVAGLRHYALRDLLPWGGDGRAAPAEPIAEGILDPYEASAMGVVSLVKATQLDLVAGAQEIAKDFAVAATGVEHAATVVLDEFAPDIVLMINGLFGAERVIRELALARGLAAPTYEFAPRGGAMVFSQDTPAPEYDVDELWARVADRPLSERQRAEVVELLNDRARGVGAHESYFERTRDDLDELRRDLGLQGRERVVSLFTNVTWDSATVGHDVGFHSMFDWVEHAVRLAGELELELVVRVHPAEARWGTREHVEEVVVSRLGQVPENVRFVLAKHALSSYALLDISDLTLTYTTTVGLEAATRGKRVAVAGETHYRGRGFTTDVAGPDDLARILASGLPAPSANEVELALRYAHMFFFRAMIPFAPIESRDSKVRRLPHCAAQLEPGADAYLDWICARILDGEHFGLPDELAVGHRTL